MPSPRALRGRLGRCSCMPHAGMIDVSTKSCTTTCDFCERTRAQLPTAPPCFAQQAAPHMFEGKWASDSRAARGRPQASWQRRSRSRRSRLAALDLMLRTEGAFARCLLALVACMQALGAQSSAGSKAARAGMSGTHSDSRCSYRCTRRHERLRHHALIAGFAAARSDRVRTGRLCVSASSVGIRRRMMRPSLGSGLKGAPPSVCWASDERQRTCTSAVEAKPGRQGPIAASVTTLWLPRTGQRLAKLATGVITLLRGPRGPQLPCTDADATVAQLGLQLDPGPHAQSVYVVQGHEGACAPDAAASGKRLPH